MTWHIWRSVLAFCGLLLVAAPATAAPATAAPPADAPPLLTVDGIPGRRVTVDTPLALYATPFAQVSPTLYLERCKGGCILRMGPNDARTNTTMLITSSQAELREFENGLGFPGAAADAEWNAIVQCMREVYSPYNVLVTDVRPTDGRGYHEAIIAGSPTDPGVGRPRDVLGLAPLANDCSAIDNVISLTFANQHPPSDRVRNICWTAAQESAHAFGLDHEYEFIDGGRSACSDPMTYRNDCGGQKFFRNEAAKCGETAVRPCRCGSAQNSHLKLVAVFGAGTPITGSPTIRMITPAAGGPLGTVVTAEAGAKRGVARVELHLNGYKWAQQAGAPFGANGQPDPSSYAISIPSSVPNSIIDVKTIAYDDLGAATESSTVTVTKGAPCTMASTCAEGQKCEAGRCFWDPPAGEIGEGCDYAQFCKTGLCKDLGHGEVCTQECIPGVADGCPADFTCVMASGSRGLCVVAETGGCCSVDRGAHGGWAHLGIAAAVLGLVLRRRPRR